MSTSKSEVNYKEFLAKTAKEIDGMFCGTVKVNDKFIEVDGSRVKARFELHCDVVTDKYKIYLDAKERADKQKSDVNLSPDPTNPGTWRVCGVLPHFYTVLAIIYNMMLISDPQGGRGWWKQRKLKDLLTRSGDTSYVFLSVMWGCIENRMNGYNEDLITIALRHVKADLIEHCGKTTDIGQSTSTPKDGKATGTGQEQKPGEVVTNIESPSSIEGVRSSEMSKSEMMSRLHYDSYYKFNQFAKRYDIKPVGKNRQLFTIRLDKMNPKDQEKLEKK